ncbi:MAG TPA: hypothetical protein VGX78_08730, partial [Pirellulales bacterium]|nr:hypothetical protein [Pirellulales bacterium]
MNRISWSAWLTLLVAAGTVRADGPIQAPQVDRSPVDLVLSPDESWLVTANQTSDTLSLVDVQSGRVIDEAPCGHRPAGLALAPNGNRVLVTASYAGTLSVFEVAQEKLHPAGSLRLGFEPVGVAVSPDGKLAYVALESDAAVAVVEIDSLREAARIEVGRWPRYLT